MVALGAFIRAVNKDGQTRKKWIAVGIVMQSLAVATSWEGALLGVPLLIVGLYTKKRFVTRLALSYMVAAFLTAALILGAMLIAAPHFRNDLWATLLFRMSGSTGNMIVSGNVHSIANLSHYTSSPTLGEYIKDCSHQIASLIGWIGIVFLTASVVLLLRRPRFNLLTSAILSVAGVSGVWLLWYVFMHNQVDDNEFQILLAAPVAALAAGYSIKILAEEMEKKSRTAAIVFLVVVYSIFGGQTTYYVLLLSRPFVPGGLVEYAREIRSSTPPDAVILSPVSSLVPVYYSQRHIIRGVADSNSMRLALGNVKKQFPGSPIFLAVRPTDVDTASLSFQNVRFDYSSQHLLLLNLTKKQ